MKAARWITTRRQMNTSTSLRDMKPLSRLLNDHRPGPRRGTQTQSCRAEIPTYTDFSSTSRVNGRRSRIEILSGRRALAYQRTTDHKPLNLIRAFVNLSDLGVAHEFFNWVIPAVAVAAEQLHRVGCNLHRGIGGEDLGHR